MVFSVAQSSDDSRLGHLRFQNCNGSGDQTIATPCLAVPCARYDQYHDQFDDQYHEQYHDQSHDQYHDCLNHIAHEI